MTVFIILLPLWILSWAFPVGILSILVTPALAYLFLRECFSVFHILIFPCALFFLTSLFSVEGSFGSLFTSYL